jgi:hypothetical protein
MGGLGCDVLILVNPFQKPATGIQEVAFLIVLSGAATPSTTAPQFLPYLSQISEQQDVQKQSRRE